MLWEVEIASFPNPIQPSIFSAGGQIQAMSKISQRLAREGWGRI